MIKFDYQYVAGWSLARDIEILLATLPAVISRPGRVLIDLHCHALPGVDDGPATLEDSLALLRAAHAAGAKTVVATPHVSPRVPDDAGHDRGAVAELRPLSPVELLAGAEVAHEPALELPDEVLRRLTLGDSRTILLESPLSPSVGPVFERAFESLLERGYRVLLAHPERAPIFLDRPLRLRALVEQGALCSITARALSGRFGQGPKWFALRAAARRARAQRRLRRAQRDSAARPGLREGMLDAAETLPFVASARRLVHERACPRRCSRTSRYRAPASLRRVVDRAVPADLRGRR